MNSIERIRAILTQELAPLHLEVQDNRHMGKDGATHYSIVIESEHFTGLSKVARHQIIYRLLDEEMESGPQALVITARTPDEP